jgi:hypothetical protein
MLGQERYLDNGGGMYVLLHCRDSMYDFDSSQFQSLFITILNISQ